MSNRRHRDHWERLFAQKKQEFLESDCRRALDISNFDELQIALQELAAEYQAGTFPDFVNRLNPSLLHVRSFTKAITSASQYESHAILVWGAIQAVMESACQNNYAVEEMLDTVAKLNEELPKLDTYLDLIETEPSLHFKLQDLYDTYMDYCISSIQYIKRSSAANFLTYFVYSSPQRALKTTKEVLLQQTKAFRRAVECIHIKSQQHKEVLTTLSSKPLSPITTESKSNIEDDLEYPISTVSLYRNYTFLGRDDVLSSMHDTLNPISHQRNSSNNGDMAASKHGQQPRCCILRGLGGIGKTQTALEYTYRYRDEYDAIFWIQSDQEHSLASTFSYIAEKLQVVEEQGGHDGQGQTRAVKRATDWLKSTKRHWLIVFDNVECMEELNPYFPLDAKTPGSVIITTQRSDFFPITNPDTTMIEDIKNLDRNAGAELIFKYLQREALDEDEKEQARMISDLLDGLPLALATIGGYINQSGDTVSNYYSNLKTSSRAWEASAIGPVKQYQKRLETVFDMALGELPENPRSLIRMLAFLNPDFIPERMFIDNIGSQEIAFLSSQAELVDMIRILRKRQLVRRDTSGSRPFLSIHRTVQWSVLLDLSNDYEHRWKVFRQAFDLVRRCLPAVSPIDNPEPEYWAQFEKFVPQILNLRSHCLWPEPPVKLPRDFAQVLSDMATYMWHAGLFQEGTEALLTAEDILDDNKVGKKDALRGNIHEHLGIFASFNGVSERKFALERREKAIEARRASYNQIPKNQITREDEIRRWNVESDMAFGFIQWEDFEKAEEYAEKCHEQYRSWGSEQEIPFEYVKYNQIMSYVLMAKQEPVKAIQHAKRGAELAELCAGLIHPTTQLLRFTLLNHLCLAGELDEALKEAQNVLRARKQIHGEFNHYTLETYSFCASLLAQEGKFIEAEQMYLKCLDRRKRMAWNQEGVARAQFLYGQTLQGLQREKDAKKEMEGARDTMNYYLEEYPQWLKIDDQRGDEMVVFDQMVSLWAGRYTGKLKQKPFEASHS